MSDSGHSHVVPHGVQRAAYACIFLEKARARGDVSPVATDVVFSPSLSPYSPNHPSCAKFSIQAEPE